jgi:YidC/Oxa1 family membrane protein insertase
MTSDSGAPELPRLSAPRNPLTTLMFVGVAVFVMMLVIYGVSNTFNLILIDPLINLLIVLDRLMLGQFGLAIILFTVLLRLVTLPLTLSFFRSSKNMQAAQPKMQEIQKKYAKDPRRQREEMSKLYKEYGINPLGCMFPFLIQILFFGALYRALTYTVGGSPESLIGLSQRLYDIPFLHESIPLNQHFLWMDLGKPDGTLILPILVFVSTYVQQKMSTPANPTPQQAQQQAMMTWMMPLIITMFMLNLASGVGLYWVASNVISLFTGYYVYGRSFDWR